MDQGTNSKQGCDEHFCPFHLFTFKLVTSDLEFVSQATEWLVDELHNHFVCCITTNGQKILCSYSSIIKDNTAAAESVAEYMCAFGRMSAAEHDRSFMDMLQYEEGIVNPPERFKQHCHFKIPYVISLDDDEDVDIKALLGSYFMCLNAIQHLLSYGQCKTLEIREDINEGLFTPHHPRVGLPSNCMTELERQCIHDDLCIFFEEFKEMEEPKATHFVCKITGLSVQRLLDHVQLPSSIRKRGLFHQFCWYCGICVTSTAKGKHEYHNRTDTEWL